ncbi:FKBP-type peptidyl-prolyl cis-trans isomerase [Crocinitomicaceae bacterium]|nr:FKBP-type peptidyl-prolyl cis-trans isomerase [Crocinitomicaceae bacterium]
MIKLGLVALIAIAMTSCGDKGDDQETVELKTDKDSLSYILGAEQAKFILEKGDPNLQKLDFDEMAAGFETAIHDKQQQMGQDCQDALEKLYGRDGKDYDSTYRKQGSHCIGGIAGSIFYHVWSSKGVLKDVDIKKARAGFRHALLQQDTLINDERRNQIASDFISGVNKKSGSALMAKANKLSNIQVIEGGIVIETIKAGSGPNPAPNSDVEVDYILTNSFGDTVENSFMMRQQTQQGVPAFNLTGVIPGWGAAFPNLQKGGKYNLYIPWEMAYGLQHQCETLKFYVELNNFGPQGTLAKMPEQAAPY